MFHKGLILAALSAGLLLASIGLESANVAVQDDTLALQSLFDRAQPYSVITIPPGTYRVAKTLKYVGKPVNVVAVGAILRAANAAMTDPLVIFGGNRGDRAAEQYWTGGRFLNGGGFVVQNLSYSTLNFSSIGGTGPGLTIRADTVAAYLKISGDAIAATKAAIVVDLLNTSAWSNMVTISGFAIATVNGPFVQQNNKASAGTPAGWLFDRCAFESRYATSLFGLGSGAEMTFRDCWLEGRKFAVGSIPAGAKVRFVRPRLAYITAAQLVAGGAVVDN